MATIVKERIEYDDESRLSVFPIKYTEGYASWKQQRELRWEPSEIDSQLEKDVIDILTLDANYVRPINYILAFFAISDGLITDIIQDKLVERIKPRELKMVYSAIVEGENVHNVIYSKIIEKYVPNLEERLKLFFAVQHFKSVGRLADMIERWATIPEVGAPVSMVDHRILTAGVDENGRPFYKYGTTISEIAPCLAQLLIGNMIVEGSLFPSQFAQIYYIYDFLKKLPGLFKSNEFISRDEGTHVNYGVYLYTHHIEHRLPQEVVHAMMTEAVDVMSDFIREAMLVPLPGMNANLLIQYVKYVQDQLCVRLNYEKLWNEQNPFTFMDKQSAAVRITDFFVDKSISEYGNTMAGVSGDDSCVSFGEDFD